MLRRRLKKIYLVLQLLYEINHWLWNNLLIQTREDSFHPHEKKIRV